MTGTRLFATLAVITLCAAGCETSDARPLPAPMFSLPPSASPSTVGLPDSFAEGTQPSPAAGVPDRLATVRVIDWLGFPDTGRLDVTFHLTEHCAYLQGPPDEPVMLVWPDGQAWIDAAHPDTVQLREPGSGKLTRITDGERVNLGGAPFTGTSFVTPPHPSCPTGDFFLVTQIM